MASSDLSPAIGAQLARAGRAAVVAAAGVRSLGACGGDASWISAVLPPGSGHDRISACLSPGSSQTEALIAVANNRDYAQLITVTGAQAEYVGSSPSRLGAELASLLGGASSTGSELVFVLGPYQRATVALDRPPPATESRPVRLGAAPGELSALAGRVWTLLSAARGEMSLSRSATRCVAAALAGATSSATSSPAALARMRDCVVGSSSARTQSGRLLRGLGATLLSQRLLSRSAALEAREPGAAGVSFTIAGSLPAPVNPSIHLVIPVLGTLPDGVSTVAHLTATGGTAPYRFYLLREPGGPAAPSWVRLTPNGTLTIRPPEGADLQLTLVVYAVDASGEYSQSLP